MASLSVSKIDDETVTDARVRAAQHGVSMAEELRRIIRQAVAIPERLGDVACVSSVRPIVQGTWSYRNAKLAPRGHKRRAHPR